MRLKPEGIFVKNDISVANWFLNGKNDVRSSYALEDTVTEFDIQGVRTGLFHCGMGCRSSICEWGMDL